MTAEVLLLRPELAESSSISEVYVNKSEGEGEAARPSAQKAIGVPKLHKRTRAIGKTKQKSGGNFRVVCDGLTKRRPSKIKETSRLITNERQIGANSDITCAEVNLSS